jgi:hypothetical protein
MRIRNWMAGVWLVAGLMALVGCGSDSNKMLKWSCSCTGKYECASSETDAELLVDNPQCTLTLSCESTGDSCSCPGGASKCELAN